MLEPTRYYQRAAMPYYPEIEWTRKQADARKPNTHIRCCTCQHHVDFCSEGEMLRFLESSFWVNVDMGYRCLVCQEGKTKEPTAPRTYNGVLTNAERKTAEILRLLQLATEPKPAA